MKKENPKMETEVNEEEVEEEEYEVFFYQIGAWLFDYFQIYWVFTALL